MIEWMEKNLKGIIWFVVTVLVLLASLTFVFRLYGIYQIYIDADDPINVDGTSESEVRLIERADSILDRANETANLAGSILSFLEGASVLVALALGAAAIFGFQNARELRQEIKDERKKTEDLLTQTKDLYDLITPHLEEIRNLPKVLVAVEEAKGSIQADFMDLLQANQELSLKNYEEAYRYARRVLGHFPENVQALYIAGWLETQYIPNMLAQACEHLEAAINLDEAAGSVKAAYGVALRRLALRAEGEERTKLFRKSLRTLEHALDENRTLLDLNRESFWGPVGGNYRDLGNLKSAIEAYERAHKVTPGSSYPVGNLGALYLQQAKEESNPNFLEKALEMFALTINLSTKEMGFNPNDYFVMMDLAMAYTMLGARNEKNFDNARRWFDSATSTSVDATTGMLNVSLGGWRRLQQGCPEVWAEVQKELDARIEEMNRVIQEREQQQNS